MGRFLDVADHKLNGEFAKDGLECLHLLRVPCCHPNPHQRPFMRTVLQVLSGEAAPLIPPESPTIIWPALPSSSKESECSLTGSQIFKNQRKVNDLPKTTQKNSSLPYNIVMQSILLLCY